jgi:hypothetical protein
MNLFFRDSKEFLTNAAEIVSENMTYKQILFATLSFSLGIERILKGILYEINPTFVLIKPEFGNSLQTLYNNKIIPTSSTNGILENKINEDVITFRNSLLRASVCSKVANDNKNMLFFISDSRDIIAHHDIQKLDFKKLENLLLSDFYPLIAGFCLEQSLSKKKILSNLDMKLAKLSSEHQSNVEERIKLKIETAIERWDILKKTSGYTEAMTKATNAILSKKHKISVECPACKNEAVLDTTPEYIFDPYSQKLSVVGAKIDRLKCQYCKILIKNYKELDSLKLFEKVTKLNILENDEDVT